MPWSPDDATTLWMMIDDRCLDAERGCGVVCGGWREDSRQDEQANSI